MFSPERILHGFINNNLKSNWKLLFNEIIYFLYFKDHLNKHFFKTHNLTIIFNNNISLEVLTLLIIFANKYSFIKLRTSEQTLKNVDLESQFIVNKNQLELDFNNSNVCLLVGINTRYESPFLNLKLRKRYLKGNFKVISINSLLDLTFPTTNIGNNLKQLKSIAEGTHVLCQTLVKKNNPFILISSDILKRKDSLELTKVLSNLQINLSTIHNKSININVLGTSLNNSGVNYLNTFKKISKKDFLNSLGLYFLNVNNISSNIKKILELKLLKYYNTENSNSKFVIKQNNGFEINSSLAKANTYINLPNNVFFASTNAYLTNDGVLKKNIKFLPSIKQTKDDWQIIRKLFSNSKNINFLSNELWNKKLSYNCNNFFNFKSYLNILYFSNKVLTKHNLFNIYQTKTLINSFKYKVSKVKLYNTPLRLWLDDFYIGGKDLYSKYSITMINCSNILKKNKNNFSYTI